MENMKIALGQNLIKATEIYSEKEQAFQTIEEMSELTKELTKKYNRNKDNRADIVDEIADVANMLEQMIIMLDVSEDELIRTRLKKSIKCLNNAGIN